MEKSEIRTNRLVAIRLGARDLFFSRQRQVSKKIILALAITSLLFLFNVNCYLPAYGEIIAEPRQGYYLSLPKSTAVNKALPVLISLPGWGVKGQSDINMWAFAAAKKGFLLIELDVDYTNANSDSDTRSVYVRIQNIINSLSRSYNIDRNKIFLSGTSAGGMTCLALSLTYPEFFKAAGMISAGRLGFGAEKFLKNAQGRNFYFFHGQKDKAIPLSEFYATKKTLESYGAKVGYKVIKEGAHTLPTSCYKDIVDWLYQLAQE